MTRRSMTSVHVLIPGFALVACLGLLLADSGSGSRATQDPGATANRYIGAAKCKSCHRSEEAGDQHGAWEQAKHSQAYATLATPAALEAAKKRGIDKPQEAAECLRCHVTGHGQPEDSFRKGFKIDEGVGCEVCHGPGELHMKARLMAAAAAAQKPDEKPAYTQVPADEIISSVGQEQCLTCHNEESPSFKPFCFHKRAGEIRHLNPLKPRTEKELAAILVCGCGDACECKHGCEDGKCGVPPTKKD